MTSRISRKLAALKKSGRKALAAYVVAGDPDLKTTQKAIFALERAGASIIELGVPFSDPMADGPAIQRASERALSRGVTMDKILSLVKAVRRESEIPILLMGYCNPILQYGPGRFAERASRAGVDAVLVVDLPPDEADVLRPHLKKRGLDAIFLVTPTSTRERVALVNRKGSGFAYYVSLTGVTGAATLDARDVADNLKRLGSIRLPVLIGFGISKPEDVRRLSPLADGVVVGSALVKILSQYPPKTALPRLERFVRTLVAAL